MTEATFQPTDIKEETKYPDKNFDLLFDLNED